MKLRTEIKRVDVFTFNFDEKIINKKWFEEFSKSFFRASSFNELADQLAFSIMRNGSNCAFHEGFGNVAMFKNGEKITHYEGDKKLKGKDYTPGIIVHILEEDDDFEYDTTEVKK